MYLGRRQLHKMVATHTTRAKRKSYIEFRVLKGVERFQTSVLNARRQCEKLLLAIGS